MRTKLEGRTIKHVVSGLELGPDAETEADHPVFRRHPVSGRTSLYLSTPARCLSISGLDDGAVDIIQELYIHSTTENTVRHSWAAGDVVMWDNGCRAARRSCRRGGRPGDAPRMVTSYADD